MGNCDNWRSTVVVVVIVVVAAVVEGHDDGVAGMVGVGATKAKLFQIGSHLSLSHLSLSAQFHMHYSITSHGHFLVFFKVFEAASAGKASSSLKKDFELPRSATVFTAHWDGRKAVIGREGKRERWGELRTCLFQPGGPKGGFLVITA